MILQVILRSLRRLISLFEQKNVPYMVIGGYALPFYGRIRSTVDLDLAVAVESKESFEELKNWLILVDFEMVVDSFLNPVVVLLDKKEKMEIELWLRPDGIVFDQDLLDRRRKMKLSEGFFVFVVSPEDFIVNKLARNDRGVIDEKDVKSVLERQKGKLDNKYLEKRAKEANVYPLLEIIKKS